MGKHKRPYIGIEGVLVKVCGGCGAAKPLTEYNRKNSTSDVLRYDCKDCVNARSRAWRDDNPDKCRTFARNKDRAERLNPRKLLDTKMRSGISNFLSGRGSYESIFSNLGYSGENLRLNLESSFYGSMSWENYGRYGWHVDHTRPLASFTYEAAEDEQFKIAWSLDNLKPLWWHENLWKGARYVAANDNYELNARGIAVPTR